jgi:intein/homing endonuclease
MSAEVNKVITGVYDHVGDAVIYGDSVTGDSMINTSNGMIAIEDLFDAVEDKVLHPSGKEYAMFNDSDITTLGFHALNDKITISKMNYVMRHKTSKQLYKVTMEDGTSVTVTEDHSLMIDRDGFLLEIKATDLQENDLVITLAK